MYIDNYIKNWAILCESEDDSIDFNSLSEKYISYVLTKNNLLDTVRYYERKAEYYVDRRLGTSPQAMSIDTKLQAAEDKYNDFINSPQNKKIKNDFFDNAASKVKEKFLENNEIKGLSIYNATENGKTKYFILKMQNDKFLVMTTEFELFDDTFNSKNEAVSKIEELKKQNVQ